MNLTLEASSSFSNSRKHLSLRILAVNESYEVVPLDKRMLVGPNIVSNDMDFPVTVEPVSKNENENIVTLNPWCLYGRERKFEFLTEGEISIFGYLTKTMTTALLPQGPSEPGNILVAAKPLIINLAEVNQSQDNTR